MCFIYLFLWDKDKKSDVLKKRKKEKREEHLVEVWVNLLLIIYSCLKFRIYFKCCFPYLTLHVEVVVLYLV